jgi:hypothetical protein
MNDYAKERNNAFIEAVINDNWNPVKTYATKYNMQIPKSGKTMKAAVYKAVQYCADISDEVKEIAIIKCIKLGFNPLIDWGV